MKKRMAIMIVALVIVFGAIFGYKAFVSYEAGKALANKKQPPVTVSTQKVTRSQWTPQIHATGSLRAVQGVQVTTEVGGKVSSLDFHSGQSVAKGDLLVQLDDSVEKAELKGQQADRKLAQQTLTRKRKLRKRRLGSQADLDQARAQYNAASAKMAGTRAMIDKKHIQAPFAGTIGLRQIDLGQYIAPGTLIATLQHLDPIYLDFDLPQASLPHVHTGQGVSLRLDAYPDHVFKGKVTAIAPEIDADTRSFGVRATLANADKRLRPGMFGKVKLRTSGSNAVITVPRTAIAYNSYGDFIYVVKNADQSGQGKQQDKDKSAQQGAGSGESGNHLKVTRRNVHTGETRGDQVQILEGLKVGEQVVIAGNNKLHPGARIKIDNSRVPKSQAHPKNVENY